MGESRGKDVAARMYAMRDYVLSSGSSGDCRGICKPISDGTLYSLPLWVFVKYPDPVMQEFIRAELEYSSIQLRLASKKSYAACTSQQHS